MTDVLGELTFHRLLVAVDGSESSDLALSAAITAARREHASVTLIAVSPTVRQWASLGVIPVPVTQDDADEATERLLREAVAKVPDDVPVTTLFKRGKAGQEIVDCANNGDFDAVLVGARGVGRVHALIGSVSQYVLHHAKIAVMVAHPPR